MNLQGHAVTVTINPHRVNWIGREGVRGFWCHAPGGCHEYAGNVRAMQTHADLYEATLRDTTTLRTLSPEERLLRDIFTDHLEES